MRIAVTGAKGFIGIPTVARLNEAGHQVINFTGDLTRQEDVEKFFAGHRDIERVVHLAGAFYGDFSELLHKNVLSCYNLAEVSSKYGIRQLVFASSGAVYGEPKNGSSRERDALNPVNDYGLSKLLAERSLEYFADGFSLTILRLPNVYGSGQTKGVIFELLRSIKESGRVKIYGNGQQVRCFLHVIDAVGAIELALNYGRSGTFNVTPDRYYSLQEVLTILRHRYNFEVVYEPVDNQLTNLILNPDRAKQILKFVATKQEIFLEDQPAVV